MFEGPVVDEASKTRVVQADFAQTQKPTIGRVLEWRIVNPVCLVVQECRKSGGSRRTTGLWREIELQNSLLVVNRMKLVIHQRFDCDESWKVRY